MLYGEKMKQILEKFNVDTSVLPDSLYSTLLDAIYNVEISGEGGIDTSSATAIASDILKSKTAYAKGVKLTGTIESKGAETYTPKTTDQTINNGVYLSGVQTIKGDVNLVADNIKNGVSIFGVNGTMPEKIDTSDADATAEDIALGKTAYVNDVKITGTMESSGGSDGIFEYIDGASGSFPKAYIKSVTIPDGATNIFDNAFYGFNKLTSVTIPNSVNLIGSSAFRSCNILANVIIPDSVKTISDYAFSYCKSLGSIVIPKSVTTIGSNAFFLCGALTIKFTGTSSEWEAISKGSNWNASTTITMRYNYVP